MKKAAITSLIIVFLTCQFSYAARHTGNLVPTKEETQELTQEEIEGIFIALLSSIDRALVDRESIDWEALIEQVEEIQDIEPLLNQDACLACLAYISASITGLLLIEVGEPVAGAGLLVLVLGIVHSIAFCIFGCLFG